ncbi:MAG: GtrA family protein [Patescibacteria group bacterium]|nr:GtrA family protein [Patescibacteria group bacterium]
MPIKTAKKFISFFFEHEKIGEPMRYLLIGGTCAVLDLLFLYLMVNFLNVWYLIATTISFLVVSLFGYFGQKHFTFRNTERNHKKQLTLFFMVTGTGLLINAGFMFAFVSLLGIWYIIANIITKFIVLVWNFLANKHITFRLH